jgi:hypothetical protein
MQRCITEYPLIVLLHALFDDFSAIHPWQMILLQQCKLSSHSTAAALVCSHQAAHAAANPIYDW